VEVAVEAEGGAVGYEEVEELLGGHWEDYLHGFEGVGIGVWRDDESLFLFLLICALLLITPACLHPTATVLRGRSASIAPKRMNELQSVVAAVERAEGVGLGGTGDIDAAGFFGTFGHVCDVAERKDELGLEAQDVGIEAKEVISAEQPSVYVHLSFQCAAEVVQHVFLFREFEELADDAL